MEKATEIESFVQLPEYSKYVMQTMSMVAAQVKKSAAFMKVYSSLSKVDIYPLVMKGLICRQLYGDYSEHRPSGDEDILIQKQDFNQVEKVLLSEGFVSEDEREYSEAQLEVKQEVTFYNLSAGLSIEVHINPIGCEDEWHKKANACFVNVFNSYREVEVDGVMIHTMSHTDHLLFLVLHTMKHFIIGGVGIRQILDILLYLREYGEECDLEYLYDSLKKLKADIFFSDLVHIGNKYLGFDLSAPLVPNCPERLLADVLDSGTFGNSTEVQRNVSAWTSAALEKNQEGKNSKVKEWLYMIFPAKSWMLRGNPELAEKPWLLPVSWVQRWVRIVKRNSANGNNLIIESKKLGQQRIELLKKYKIL